MSRIGKLPVPLTSDVKVVVNGTYFEANGPKGKLFHTFPEEVSIEIVGDQVVVKPINDTQKARACWGLTRSLVRNMVEGVSKGYQKILDINGVGFRAAAEQQILTLYLGFSHEIKYIAPKGIKITTPKPTEIIIEGFDKQLVGQVAAEIRSLRKPEPYKGKGIKYRSEVIRRKEGKKK
jgi:large subunit ribosomal protein L6